MARLSWDTFVTKHAKPFGLLAQVSSKLSGPSPHLDKARRKLPTPYGLFQQWAAAHLSGDWSSTTVSGGFLLCVATAEDAKTIIDAFGATTLSRPIPECANTALMGYRDRSYGSLAKALGYSV